MAITTGVGGLEKVHTWNGFNFNDLTASPRAKLTGIPGLWSRPEFADPRFPNTGRRGEHVLPGALGGKTVVYEGIIQARTLDAWRTMRRNMSGACLSTATRFLEIDGSPDWVSLGRIIDCDIDEDPDLDLNRWWTFEGKFSVSIRLEDGRFLALAKHTSASQSSGGTLVVNNAGNGDAEPDFSVSSVTTATVENLTTGTKLKFEDMPSGTLTLLFHTHTALIGSADAMEFFNGDDSDWWDEFTEGLRPGNNSIKVTGGSWTVAWYDTDA